MVLVQQLLARFRTGRVWDSGVTLERALRNCALGCNPFDGHVMQAATCLVEPVEPILGCPHPVLAEDSALSCAL